MANKTTHKGEKLYVCATAQDSDLNQAGFEALVWVPVGKVGDRGDWGSTSNLPTYNTLDEAVSQKQKGVANAGDPKIEVARIFDDAGQIIMRTFGDPLNQHSMAVKLEFNDKPVGYSTNTIKYSRGVVSGPQDPGGSSDDFVREQYTVGLNQLPITVNPQP
jgi:hypothetical protein